MGFVAEKEMAYDPVRLINIQFMINQNYRIELIQPVSEKSSYWRLLKKYKNVPYHFCYIADDFIADIERMQGEGYVLLQPPETASCIDNNKVAFLMHPKLGIIELIELSRN